MFLNAFECGKPSNDETFCFAFIRIDFIALFLILINGNYVSMWF